MTIPIVNEMTPVLESNDMDKTIEFYTKTCGFHLDFTWPDEGPVDHAGFSIGEINETNHEEGKHVHFHLTSKEARAKKRRSVIPAGYSSI